MKLKVVSLVRQEVLEVKAGERGGRAQVIKGFCICSIEFGQDLSNAIVIEKVSGHV